MAAKKTKRPAATTSSANKRPAAKAAPAKATAAKPTSKPAHKPAPEVKLPDKDVEVQRGDLSPDFIAQMHDALLRRRRQLANVVRSNQDQLAESQRNYADIGDRASEGAEDELAGSLLSIESDQMDEIELALQRLDAGTYGMCADCGKPIPRKRLEFLPFAKRCLVCEGQKEKQYHASDDDDEEEGEFE